MDFGPCCCCGRSDVRVRNIIMLKKRAPAPGTGWGCFQCDLPPDGAVYVCCDRCLGKNEPPREVVSGKMEQKGRAPVESLAPEAFEHDFTRHPELEFLAPVELSELDDDDDYEED